MKYVLYLLGGIIGLVVLYVVGNLVYATITSYEPAEQETLTVENSTTNEVIQLDSNTTLSFLNWNIGYSGLGKESDFFYDGGEMVRPEEKIVDKNIEGIHRNIVSNEVDFYLLQEVDQNSKRSYYKNQFESIGAQLSDYARTFALNYNVQFVVVPYTNPMGKTYSGLGTFSKNTPTKSTRFQFPGSYEWPTYLFQLDRCFMMNRYDLSNGKELIVINTHNSAYDDGSLKKQQMAYLRGFLLEEYEAGNYVVVGGDWNQCPPGFKYDELAGFGDDAYTQVNIEEDYMPEGWKWSYDRTIPTNRKLATAYEEGKTFVTLIDFFLTSPNIEVEALKNLDLKFEYSDHQPTKMKVKLL